MELRHLRYFVAVGEELHFGRAAALIHVAQPALSRQIRDLEGELGLQLFERDRRHVALTAAGVAFLKEAQALLAQVDRAVENARRAERGAYGLLRIGYVPAIALNDLPDIVRAFRKRLPRVEVRLQEMPPARQVEELMAERIDVGFARGPIDEPALAAALVREEPLVAALPSSHRLRRRRRLELQMLAHEPFILAARSRGPGFHDHILAICRAAGFTPRVVQEGSQTDALSLVAAGAGVAIVPRSLRVLRRTGVVYRPLRERPTTQLAMIWPKNAASPVLREFLHEVQRFGSRANGRTSRAVQGSGE